MLRQLKKRLLPLMDTVAELLELLPTLSEPSVYLKDGVQALTQSASVLEEEGEPGRKALGQARDLARALTQDELDLQALLQDVRTLQREIHQLPTQLKVVFMPDYKVSLAEVLMPGADVSLQSSTAGFEASGTGNMKFALNGALTVGTYDGANIEIREAVGAENFYLFGLREEQIQEMRRNNSYNPKQYYENSDYIKRIMNAVNSNLFCEKDYVLLFKLIYEELLNRDYFFVLADLEAFTQAIHEAEKDYLDKEKWAKKAILNVANIGYFSSDRAVLEYADKIWNVKPV